MKNKLEKPEYNYLMENYSKTNDILKDMRDIIDQARDIAYKAVNSVLLQRNWLIGYRIAEEELQGADRAEYGAKIIAKLAKELTVEYGKGFTKTNLYNFYSFYKAYPKIFHSLSGKSAAILSWTHYRILLQVNDKQARDWYAQEAFNQTWSVRTLQRNISSQYYYRMLQTQKKELVRQEMEKLTASSQEQKLEFIKNPIVAEFLGFSPDTSYTESDLEQSIISNLQKFMMELGKGYAFVARQLVFYNYTCQQRKNFAQKLRHKNDVLSATAGSRKIIITALYESGTNLHQIIRAYKRSQIHIYLLSSDGWSDRLLSVYCIKPKTFSCLTRKTLYFSIVFWYADVDRRCFP